MALDNSVVFICADADLSGCNAALSAFIADAPNSPEISRALCPLKVGGVDVDPTGATPTAWGGAMWLDGVSASALKDWPNGVSPSLDRNGDAIDWGSYSLTESGALASIVGHLHVQVATGPNADPMANFVSLMGSLGLQFVQYEL